MRRGMKGINMFQVSIRPPGYGSWESHYFASETEAMAFGMAELKRRGADTERHRSAVTWHEDGYVMAVWVLE